MTQLFALNDNFFVFCVLGLFFTLTLFKNTFTIPTPRERKKNPQKTEE